MITAQDLAVIGAIFDSRLQVWYVTIEPKQNAATRRQPNRRQFAYAPTARELKSGTLSMHRAKRQAAARLNNPKP